MGSQPTDWVIPLRPPDSGDSAGRLLGVLLCLRDITPLLEELCDGVSLERLLQVGTGGTGLGWGGTWWEELGQRWGSRVERDRITGGGVMVAGVPH